MLHLSDLHLRPNQRSEARFVAGLAALEPEIALSFHGRPMQGAGMRAALHRLATGFRDIAVPREGRYLDDPRRAEDGSAYEKP